MIRSSVFLCIIRVTAIKHANWADLLGILNPAIHAVPEPSEGAPPSGIRLLISQWWRIFRKFRGGWLSECNSFFLVHRCISGKIFLKIRSELSFGAKLLTDRQTNRQKTLNRQRNAGKHGSYDISHPPNATQCRPRFEVFKPSEPKVRDYNKSWWANKSE